MKTVRSVCARVCVRADGDSTYICKEERPLCLFHLEAFDLLLNPLVLLQLLLRGPLTVEVRANAHKHTHHKRPATTMDPN